MRTQRYWAPGPEEEPLGLPASPWVYGRLVTIPLPYWERILEFARQLDPEATHRLELQSGNPGFDEDEIEISSEEAARTAAFLGRLADAIDAAEPLVPEATAEFPEAYRNEELARMARAAQAVFATAAERGEHHSAWNE